MYETGDMLFLYVETPLHAGSGTGLGAVDLPVQRERVTGYPIVQASGLKGALRAMVGRQNAKQDVAILFGPEGHEHAGAVSFGDARLLLFPVRSLVGVFAWATSRDVLARFLRYGATLGMRDLPRLPEEPKDNQALVPEKACDLVPPADSRLVLEEFTFKAQSNSAVERWAEWLVAHALPQAEEYTYWRGKLPRSLVVLPEDAFRDFTLHATEVVTRVRLDSGKKTVERGALWTEEYLPVDTVLYAPVLASAPRRKPDDLPETWKGKGAEDVLAGLKGLVPPRLQLGGDETVGRGMVHLRWAGGKKNG